MYVSGLSSSHFPVTVGAYLGSVPSDAGIVAKLNQTGTQVIWATFVASAAGNGVAHIDIDASGDVYAAIGSSVVKLNPDGKSAAYTFSGWTSDFASDLAVDSQGAAWIAGQVGNAGGFIRKLSPDGFCFVGAVSHKCLLRRRGRDGTRLCWRHRLADCPHIECNHAILLLWNSSGVFDRIQLQRQHHLLVLPKLVQWGFRDLIVRDRRRATNLHDGRTLPDKDRSECCAGSICTLFGKRSILYGWLSGARRACFALWDQPRSIRWHWPSTRFERKRCDRSRRHACIVQRCAGASFVCEQHADQHCCPIRIATGCSCSGIDRERWNRVSGSTATHHGRCSGHLHATESCWASSRTESGWRPQFAPEPCGQRVDCIVVCDRLRPVQSAPAWMPKSQRRLHQYSASRFRSILEVSLE